MSSDLASSGLFENESGNFPGDMDSIALVSVIAGAVVGVIGVVVPARARIADLRHAEREWIRAQRSDAYRKVLDAVANHNKLSDDPYITALNSWATRFSKWGENHKTPEDVPPLANDAKPEEVDKFLDDVERSIEHEQSIPEPPEMPDSLKDYEIRAWREKRSDALSVADTEVQMWASDAMQSEWGKLMHAANDHDEKVSKSGGRGDVPVEDLLRLTEARNKVRVQARIELQGVMYHEARRQPSYFYWG